MGFTLEDVATGAEDTIDSADPPVVTFVLLCPPRTAVEKAPLPSFKCCDRKDIGQALGSDSILLHCRVIFLPKLCACSISWIRVRAGLTPALVRVRVV